MNVQVSQCVDEIAAGDRFAFGQNWSRFLATLTGEQIRQAETALESMLGPSTLDGKTFLDLGSGSGLSSLAARNLGASVVSVDLDPHSVACTLELKRRFWNNDDRWHVWEASVLDTAFLRQLGQFDVVYSWGVLHHTGAMWDALANTVHLTHAQGRLFVSIYNDQGTVSQRWRMVKRIYNRTPRGLRCLLEAGCFLKLWWRRIVKDALRGKPVDAWRTYQHRRGMSLWRDVVDWVGGYPFEVAKPEEIFRFFRDRDFTLHNLKTNGGSMGCNEYVFIRAATDRNGMPPRYLSSVDPGDRQSFHDGLTACRTHDSPSWATGS